MCCSSVRLWLWLDCLGRHFLVGGCLWENFFFLCFAAMLRERRQAGLGPYYARAGTAPPCPGPPRTVVSQRGPGLAAPAIDVKPDTWSSWPKLSIATALPLEGATLVEHRALQGSCSSRVGPIIGIGSGHRAEELELQKWTEMDGRMDCNFDTIYFTGSRICGIGLLGAVVLRASSSSESSFNFASPFAKLATLESICATP